jgi:hypothetical protein
MVNREWKEQVLSIYHLPFTIYRFSVAVACHIFTARVEDAARVGRADDGVSLLARLLRKMARELLCAGGVKMRGRSFAGAIVG